MTLGCASWRHAGAALLLAVVGALPVAAAPFDRGAVTTRPPRQTLPDGWQHGAFMEIFVRAYRDSDGDGVGDLKGLTRSLDYLQWLGIRGLWLMPITSSADGDHGYATTDFRDIEPAYGTLADFDHFLEQAHRRGIGVIVDYTINHAAAQHPAFVEALKGPDNPYRRWFVWQDDAPKGWDIWGANPWYWAEAQPWAFSGKAKEVPPAPPEAKGHYFGTFGPHMPDFDMRNPEVVRFHVDSLNFWLNRGLDGFRLDAVPHLIENDAVNWNDQPESRALTKRLQDTIKAAPGRYVVCEATAEPQAYGDPAVCGGAFAFGYVEHFVRAAKGQAASVAKLAEFYRSARPTMATFVSNHDIFAGLRLWDQVGGDDARYRLAAAGYLLQPGTPFIYFGEEVGQASVTTLADDLPIRSPMSWTPDARTAGFTRGKPFRPVAPNVATHNVQTQRRDPKSLLHFYRAMLKLRNTLPSIARGSFDNAFAQGLVLGYERRFGRERTLVLTNYGSVPAVAAVSGLPPKARLSAAWPARAAAPSAGADGRVDVPLPPQSVRVFVVAR